MYGQSFTINDPVGLAQQGNGLRTEAVPFQSFAVQTAGFRGISGNHQVGWNILDYYGSYCSKTVLPDPAELVYTGKTSTDDMISDRDMAGQRRMVGKYHMAADVAIVCYVYIGHDPVFIADQGPAAAVFRAAVYGAVFPDGIAIADGQRGKSVSLVFFVLRIIAYGTELEDPVPLANGRGALDDHVRSNPAVITDSYLRPHNSIGADRDIPADAGPAVDLRRGMDQEAASKTVVVNNSAAATKSPSMVAWP